VVGIKCDVAMVLVSISFWKLVWYQKIEPVLSSCVNVFGSNIMGQSYHLFVDFFFIHLEEKVNISFPLEKHVICCSTL